MFYYPIKYLPQIKIPQIEHFKEGNSLLASHTKTLFARILPLVGLL